MIDKCILFGDDEAYFIKGNLLEIPSRLPAILYAYENKRGNTVIPIRFEIEVSTVLNNNIKTIDDTIKFLKQAKRNIEKENRKMIRKDRKEKKKSIIL